MRGGAEQFIEETERSLHDAIMIVRRAIKNDSVVAGAIRCFVTSSVWSYMYRHLYFQCYHHHNLITLLHNDAKVNPL